MRKLTQPDRKFSRPARRAAEHGAAAIEYLMVLALVVIPLAIMINTAVLWSGNGTQVYETYQKRNQTTIIPVYERRINSTIVWPIG